MTITLLDEQTIAIGELDLLRAELLVQIPLSAEPADSIEAHDRLFPSPTGGRDRALDRDWENYVEPGLRELFQSSLQIIEEDLADFPPDKSADLYTLTFPISHLEAWIHGLNQARHALAARYNFTEEEMEGPIPLNGDTRLLGLFQVRIYTQLQAYFLDLLGDG